jgi:hypothetical protein
MAGAPSSPRDATALRDGAAVSDDAIGLTQRDLLMEMREDIKGVDPARPSSSGVAGREGLDRQALRGTR